MATDYLVVMVTVADAEAGVALGKALVAEGLAGCVQVIPGGTAIYRWQGQLRTDYQVQLFIKTPRAAWEALQARILELHGDEVPEILALPVLDGLPSYLQWLDESEQGEETAVGWQDYGLLYPGDEHTVSGTLKVLRGVESPQFGNRRDLVVYLPPSYGEGDRRYPVIYMHDGQNLFDAATSNAGEWQVDETLETLSTEGIEAIVVGVPNMGEKRAYEYVSFPSSWLAEVGGDLYTAFLAETVKPLIDRDFRTLPEREATGVMGSSLGGLISLYAIFRRPDVFGMAGVVSLAIGQVSPGITRFVKKSPFPGGTIYLDVGTAERLSGVKDRQAQAFARRYVTEVRQMRDLLERKGYRPGENLLYVEEEGGIHHESSWARRLPDALRFLLRNFRQSPEMG